MVAVLGYSREQIFTAVKDMYTAVAEAPDGKFHFPLGRAVSEALRYPKERIDRLPTEAVDSFAGVGNPFRAEVIQPGDTVLDIGAGAGTDSLIAAGMVGAQGKVIALDLTPAMARKLRTTAQSAGYGNVTVMEGSAESIPLPDQSVDVISSNGALNLVPDKRRAVAEMFRVLRSEGWLQIADVVIRRPVTVNCDDDPRLWVECVVGATVDEDLFMYFRDAGFEDLETVGTNDYFALSPSAQTREIAAGFAAYSMELKMRRAARAPSRVVQYLKRLNPWRWLKALWRRGLAGMTGLVLALVACYGTLATVALLPLMGVNLALDEGLWAGAIAVFTLLTTIAVGFGMRRHGARGPLSVALVGAGIINYALFVDYHMITEAFGFAVLIGSVSWDLYLKKRREKLQLGLADSS